MTPLTDAGRWNPRYVAFAASEHRTPGQQAQHDAQAYPLAPTLPFVWWLRPRLQEYRAVRFIPAGRSLTAEEDGDFEHWVAARYPAVGAAA